MQTCACNTQHVKHRNAMTRPRASKGMPHNLSPSCHLSGSGISPLSLSLIMQRPGQRHAAQMHTAQPHTGQTGNRHAMGAGSARCRSPVADKQWPKVQGQDFDQSFFKEVDSGRRSGGIWNPIADLTITIKVLLNISFEMRCFLLPFVRSASFRRAPRMVAPTRRPFCMRPLRLSKSPAAIQLYQK